MPASTLPRLAQLAICASACLATPTLPKAPQPSLRCQYFDIPVAARAVNKILPENWSDIKAPQLIPNLLASLESAGTAAVEGKYTIAARFCPPLNDVEKRRDTLQVLVHGVGYTKDYWSGPATEDIGTGSTNSSWIYYAAQQGYPTLAIDRLCSGTSSKPNGIVDCQLPLEAAVIEKVVEAARDGALPGIETKFSNIIYIGHSFGSMIGNFIAASKPSTFDKLILTGFSEKLLIGASSIILRPGWLPASFLSDRFGTADVGYLTASSRKASDRVFYGDDIDSRVLDYAWKTRGIFTVGEMLTALLGQGKASGFSGDVFVLNGDQDNLFCASNPITATEGKRGRCEAEDTSKHVQRDYPAARRFDYLNLPNTGHSLLLHRDASVAISAAHEFIAAG
ncbi:hypothetical protein NLG97_g10809 [Lecanicillium saksenae]|uniref:Uncharacterized protein n=1 Tax=Lecanicillium saksenae TaxID=468837 RepID=A0ACC1QCB9_9HYPO|nr:hypothetical protein NLG97_g10809 [Lecanicillium saksenae]